MSQRIDSTTVSGRVRMARQRAGLTQQDLAERVGITQPSVSELERGDSQRSAYLPEIAVECGVDIHWLAFGDGAPVCASPKTEHSVLPAHQELSFCLDGIGFAGMPLERVAKYMTALADLVGETAIFIRMTDSSIVFCDDSGRNNTEPRP